MDNKHEKNCDYVICGTNAIDQFGNVSGIFWINWIWDNRITSGFSSVEEARRFAENHCEKHPEIYGM